MGKFEKYFLMNESDVIEYIAEKYEFFGKNESLSCVEIGDGNLNYVFRIQNQYGDSIIVKHSGIETRARSGRLIDVDRNRIEAEILIRQDAIVPGLVPKVYTYDETMCCCIMEDLKEYEVLRTALLNQNVYHFFAEQITDYLVGILLTNTDVCLEHKIKKGLVKSYINPDLCHITEQLVYSEALLNISKKNYCVEGLVEFLEQEVYQDTGLHLEGAKLKFEFMEHAQSLIHGDLHSGSIFISDKDLKVFDPEFAFYGPVGYDLGNVIAHMLFALIYSEGTQTDKLKRDTFKKWSLDSIESIVDLFVGKFLCAYKKKVTDDLAKVSGFAEYYLDGILSNAAGTCGMELIRRIVGVAKVKDLTAIQDLDKRVYYEKQLILLAKKLIFERESIKTGAGYTLYINQEIFGGM